MIIQVIIDPVASRQTHVHHISHLQLQRGTTREVVAQAIIVMLLHKHDLPILTQPYPHKARAKNAPSGKSEVIDSPRWRCEETCIEE